MDICIISNGHGEDTIACQLALALRHNHKDRLVKAIPLVGSGHAYHTHNIETIGTNPTFPSGGFIRSITHLVKDLKAGLLRHIVKQRRWIRTYTKPNTLIIAVGDVTCLWMAACNRNAPIYFLPTAKSDTFMPHSKLERWLIKRWATHSFPRDTLTTEAFTAHQLPATFLGNPMMDNLTTSDTVISAPSDEPIIGLLPGSREEAYDNLIKIAKVCSYLPQELSQKPHFLVALAPTMNLSDTTLPSDWSYQPYPQAFIHRPTQTTLQVTSQFLAVINQAHLIIGLAGTANEQAAFLGKKVICFKGSGPQTTAQRFKEQHQLMGDRIIYCDSTQPKDIINVITNALTPLPDPTPTPTQHTSASDAIIDYILSA